MSNYKNKTWGQESPRAQILITLQAIERHLANFEKDTIIDSKRMVEQVRGLCAIIDEVATEMSDMDRWPDKSRAALTCRALDFAIDETKRIQKLDDAGKELPRGWSREGADALYDVSMAEWMRQCGMADPHQDLDRIHNKMVAMLAKYEDPAGSN